MSRKIPSVNTCCFCFSLRTATLFLASLGFFSSLLNTYVSSAQPNSSILYGRLIESGLCAAICCGGIYGIWKNNVKLIRLFATFYWVRLAVGVVRIIADSTIVFMSEDYICDEIYIQNHLDVDTCHEYYFKLALTSVIISSLLIAIDVYGAIAVWSYYRQTTSQASYCIIEQETAPNSEKKQLIEV